MPGGTMGEAEAPRPSVLIIDDDDDMRTLLRVRLELDGRFAVVGDAANGAHGVGMAKVHRPDAVVLDVLMPVIDARATLSLLRLVVPNAVVVTCSALGAEHPRVKVLRGTAAHVCKTDQATLPDVLYEAWEARRRIAV
jgi:DNA-binding NarL/FixJ family response regulator